MAVADTEAEAASASGTTNLRMLMLSLRVVRKLPPTVSISYAIAFPCIRSNRYRKAKKLSPQIGAWVPRVRPAMVRGAMLRSRDDRQNAFRRPQRAHQRGLTQFPGARHREEPARAAGELVRPDGPCDARGF